MNNEKVFICLLVNIALFIFIGEMNHQLAPINVHLQTDVLYILFAGLYFRMLHGAIFVAIFALIANTTNPLPYGSLFLIYLSFWMIIIWARPRIRRENPAHVKILAIGLQLILSLFLSLKYNNGLLTEYFYLFRVIVDLSLSVFLLLIVTHIWNEFQRHLMLAMGWDLNSEYQEYP